MFMSKKKLNLIKLLLSPILLLENSLIIDY